MRSENCAKRFEHFADRERFRVDECVFRRIVITDSTAS